MWFALVVPAAWACDAEEAQNTAEAVASTPDDLQDELAAIGISQACLGLPLTDAAARFAQGSDDLRRAADLELATTDADSWTAVCVGGADALTEAIALDPELVRAALWEPCGLSETGWFTKAEWSAGTAGLVIPLVAGRALADGEVDAATTRVLVRAVAGIVGTGRTKPTFATDGRVEPDWSKKADKKGGSCLAKIAVKPNGRLRKVIFDDDGSCPGHLQDDVTEAIEASSFVAGSEDGTNTPGRFKATYDVGG